MKQKLLLLLVAILATINASAYDFEVDGIYYNKSELNAIVTYKNTNYNSYSGSVTIPSTVTYNGTKYTVTSIGAYAFSRCKDLTSVNIAASITSIGVYAFSGCTSLTSLAIPESVTSIGLSAFTDTGIYKKSSNWENDVLYISNCLIVAKNTLNGCYTIKNDTRLISYGAFSGCTGLTSVIIPESVSILGVQAFRGCTSLKDVVIPNSVTSINGTFWGCSGLTDVVIPNTVTSIESAFGDCTGLTEIAIPESVTSIGSYTFYGCTGLTEIAIPESVTSIGFDAFSGCTSLKSVAIPNAVTLIDSYAFEGCFSLKEVTIPESVTEIGHSAFRDCSDLTTVNFNATKCTKTSSFSTYPIFEGCDKLTKINIADNVTNIPSFSFLGCLSLKEVTIPESVTEIGHYAFRDCISLTTVNFNATHCKAMGSFTTGPVFDGCSNLSTVNIGDNVSCIPEYAFWGCTGLTEVTIPNSVHGTGRNAFKDCIGLTTVNINTNGFDFPAFSPSSYDYAFAGCSKLTKINMGDGVNRIPSRVFRECTGLTEITIPNSVASIGSQTFFGCTGLISIYVYSLDPGDISMGNDVFEGVLTTTCVLHVPSGTKELYAAADQWKEFENIEEMPVLATSVALNQISISIHEGETCPLIATVSPEETTDKTIVWSSSNEAVATVDSNGLVTAVGEGTAIITATCGEVSATCKVNVTMMVCDTPEITLDEEGNLSIKCVTEGAKIHTSVVCEDQHSYTNLESGAIIPLTGQYNVTAYATAENMADSAPATAVLVWTKAADVPTGVDEINTGTERALLIRSVGENIEIVGTVANENVALFNISGVTLYSGKSNEGITTIPVALSGGEIYVITVGTHSFKYKF